jgi:molybdenum cofactor guanylyltransferase
MRTGCSLVILAGGRSRRMGRDKAGLPARGRTLIEHLVLRLAPAVDETIIVGGSTRLPLDGVRQIDDCYPGLGPLAGMHAGFVAAEHSLVWVVACDLPDVAPGLLPVLLDLAIDHEAVVPRVDGEPQAVCALYRRSLATRVEGLLRRDDHSVKNLLRSCRVRYVDGAELRAADPELGSFRNINTPADYEAWLKTTGPAVGPGGAADAPVLRRQR